MSVLIRYGNGQCWRPLLKVAGLAAVLLASGCPPEGPGTTGGKEPGDHPVVLHDVWPPRAVWVVRRPYHSPDEIADLMEQIRQAGFNAVLFQVRGNGTVYYRSSVEPWSEEYGYADPGFDPLAVACREAHERGLALHAWVNVMPGWKGRKPPENSSQVYHLHPEWFWYDQHGQRQPLSDFYVSLNPCLPEVRRYLVDVFREIVRDYPVDGLHLDYIRFPTDVCPKTSDYPYDPETLKLYRRASGKRPQDDKPQWTQWRSQQVTNLVRDIHTMIRRVRPDAKLTAACSSKLDTARSQYYQDAPSWLRGRLVDLVFVMNYSKDTRTYQLRQEAWRRAAPGELVAAGIGAYMHDSGGTTVEQLELARKWGDGFSVFSSNALFGESAKSRQRLQAIQPVLHGMRSSGSSRSSSSGQGVDIHADTTIRIEQSSTKSRKLVP